MFPGKELYRLYRYQSNATGIILSKISTQSFELLSKSRWYKQQGGDS